MGEYELYTLSATTHHRTLSGSCTGDCGPTGIEEFREKHTCNRICKSIGLHAIEEDLAVAVASEPKRKRMRMTEVDCKEPPRRLSSYRRSSSPYPLRRSSVSSPPHHSVSQLSPHHLPRSVSLGSQLSSQDEDHTTGRDEFRGSEKDEGEGTENDQLAGDE